MRRQALEKSLQTGRRLGMAARGPAPIEVRPCEVRQISLLRRTEAQRWAKRTQRMRRRIDVAPLLEPDIPRRADPGGIRDLFASQAEGATAAADGDPEIRWIQAFPPAAQELRELITPRLVKEHGSPCARIRSHL